MSYIGEKGARRLGPDNTLSLDQAKEMAKRKSTPLDIKIKTGWELGVDRLWRYEITDPFLNTQTIEDYIKPRFGQKVNIRMILGNEQILTAYPELQRLTLYAMYSPKGRTAGYFNPNTYGMVVSMGTPSDKFEFQIEGVLLHEIQHLIQAIEGFAPGGSPKTLGWKRYLRLAGEVEARNICARHFLTDDDRRYSLRTDTQDIPDADQIIQKNH